MAQYLNDDLEYVEEDYDMAEFDDDDGEFGENEQQNNASEGSHLEGNAALNQRNDITAIEFRNGKDMQGIPWEKLNYSRTDYRKMRLQQYKNYENLYRSREALEKECKKIETKATFFDFQLNTRIVKSTVAHFQLRNLLWATSKHDVYTIQNYSVMHWSSLLRRGKEVLNVANKLVPNQKNCGSSTSEPLSRVQISTMAVKDGLIVAGGFQGELVCKYLNNPGVDFCTKVICGDNAITNAVDVCMSPNGSLQVMAANNDCYVRIFDANNFSLLSRFSYSWSVNSTSVSPDGKFLAVLGDSTDCLIVDAQSGKVVTHPALQTFMFGTKLQPIGNLKGHLDYSFSSAWHPNGHILATGNQDTTCRLWDVRLLSESLSVLKGQMGAIRGIKFSNDGNFMAMAEPADFVHVFDARADYGKAQEIDLLSEIAGISFSPDTESLFVGIADRTYGSLLEFRRRHRFHYLDSFL